jgi:hypothetical protein
MALHVHRFDKIFGLHSSHKYLELGLITIGILCIITGIIFMVELGKPSYNDTKSGKLIRNGKEKSFFVGGIILIVAGVINIIMSIYAIHKYEKFKK